MKKVFYMLSLFMLALITSCTTDSLDSGVNLDIETTKLDNLPIVGKDSWQSYGIVRLENKDSVYIGDLYNLRYVSGHPIKIFLEDLSINKIVQTESTYYYLQINSLLDVFIEELYEDENKISFAYTTRSELDEYNMDSFTSFTLEKMNLEEFMFISGIEELIKTIESEVELEGKSRGIGFGGNLAYLIIKYIIDDGRKESCTDQAIRACGDNGIDEVRSSFGKCSYTCK